MIPDCIFCKIIKGEVPANFIYRDDDVVVFPDIHPKAPVHVLVLPVKHLDSLKEVNVKDRDLVGKLMMTVKSIAEKLGLAESGYKVVINNGKDAGQLIYHLHVHLLGGWNRKVKWEV